MRFISRHRLIIGLHTTTQRIVVTGASSLLLGMALLTSFNQDAAAQKAAPKPRSYAVVCDTDRTIEADPTLTNPDPSQKCHVDDGGIAAPDPSDQGASAPIDTGAGTSQCSASSPASVANCYPTAASAPKPTVTTGGTGGGGETAWQTACSKNFATATAACQKNAGTMTACEQNAKTQLQSCTQAADNSAQQHTQPSSIVPAPTQASVSVASCQAAQTRNIAYCSKMANAQTRQACQAQIAAANNQCNADAKQMKHRSL